MMEEKWLFFKPLKSLHKIQILLASPVRVIWIWEWTKEQPFPSHIAKIFVIFWLSIWKENKKHFQTANLSDLIINSFMKVKCLFQNHKKWYRKIQILAAFSKKVLWNMETVQMSLSILGFLFAKRCLLKEQIY